MQPQLQRQCSESCRECDESAKCVRHAPRTSAGWLTVGGMHAPFALSLVAVTPSPGTGSGAATVVEFALIAAYLAGLVWLHRRRRRRRRRRAPRDVDPATASLVAAHR